MVTSLGVIYFIMNANKIPSCICWKSPQFWQLHVINLHFCLKRVITRLCITANWLHPTEISMLVPNQKDFVWYIVHISLKVVHSHHREYSIFNLFEFSNFFILTVHRYIVTGFRKINLSSKYIIPSKYLARNC